MKEYKSPEPPGILLEKIKKVEDELKKYVSEKLIKYGKNKILDFSNYSKKRSRYNRSFKKRRSRYRDQIKSVYGHSICRRIF